ncbi:MAG: enoyl-CoA hydratase/isomerase family protein [Burkholderiales bacterium]|nr:enoyl-CoA hydratase/isomerase family protein [Burkholderiales bacterium]
MAAERFEHLIYDRSEHRVTLTLNRPERINALNERLTREFETAMLAAENDDDIRVIVIKGAGRGFCAGHDYAREHFKPGERETGHDTEQHRIDFEKRMRAYMRVWEIPKPVIAQVHGPCIAAGTIIAGLADIVVTAHDAKIGPVEAAPGMVMGLIWGAWLPVVGLRKTKDFAFLHGTMDGREAQQCGFATRSVPLARLEETVNRMADEIARVPLEILMMKKLAINRSANRMGVRDMMEINFEMSLAGHFSNTRSRWGARLEAEGFKQVMSEWKRDTRYDRTHDA